MSSNEWTGFEIKETVGPELLASKGFIVIVWGTVVVQGRSGTSLSD